MAFSADKKFIFCVSPGRSGSNYLYHILSCADHVCATHEPEHEHREYSHLTPRLWDLKNCPLPESYIRRKQAKLAQINEMMSRTSADIYVETNPLFCSLWQDVILDELHDHDVIILMLRRNTSEVLKSLLDLGWFSTRDGNNWMTTAYSVNSLAQPVVTESEATPSELIISYLMNVEMLAQMIKKRCRKHGLTVIELDSNRLFGSNEIIANLFTRCGLHTDTEKLNSIIFETKNKPGISKKILDTPLDACTKAIENYLKLCREHSLDIPGFPYT